MLKRIAFALIIVLFAAGCSSGTNSDSSESPEAGNTETQSSAPLPTENNNDPKSLVNELASQLSADGISCQDPELQETPILFDGARVDCTVNGTEFRIEVYPEDKFPEMVKYLVDNGFGSLTTLTNGTSWVCTGNKDALEAAKSSLGGSIIALENL